MATEFDIEINDRISASISQKLEQIASSANNADGAVRRLQTSIASLNSSRLQSLTSSFSALNQAVNQAQSIQASLVAQYATTNRSLQNLTNSQNTLTRSVGYSSGAWRVFYGLIFSVAPIFGAAAAVINLADSYTVLQNKLQIVSATQEQNNELTNRAFELANKTRSGVLETAQAFARFDRALKGLGESQESSLRLTETVNKALIVSGATSREAASSLLQLSQAFNSGRLMGDEFRSVSENIPIVLDAISKVLGKPVNELKKLSSEGKITSKVLSEAFKLIEKDVDSAFAKTTPTISQAFTVLNNSAIQFFGELNKATGATKALSLAIIALANNLDVASVAAVALGSALLLLGGPRIVAGILSVGRAFRLAFIANPIGLFIAALATAAAYFVNFGDTIDAGLPGFVTFSELASAAFTVVGGALKELGTFAKSEFEKIKDVFSGLTDLLGPELKNSLNAATSSFLSFFETNKTGWAALLENIAKTLDAIGGLIIGAFNFASLVAKGQLEFKNAGQQWAQSLDEGFKTQGSFLSKGVEKIFAEAEKKALDRKAKAKLSSESELRSPGVATFDDIQSSAQAKAEESRAARLGKINAELDNEIARAFKLQPLREEQARFDKIQETLMQKRVTLTAQESEEIRKKVLEAEKAKQIQQDFDRIYSEAAGPLRDYQNSLEAADRLLALGAISQEQYNREITKNSEAYLNSTNYMREYNRRLDEELTLLNLLPAAREIEAQVLQFKNDKLREGIILSKQEEEGLREKLKLLQQVSAESQLRDSTVGQREQFNTQADAISSLRKKDKSFTKADAATSASDLLQRSGIDISGTNLQFEAEQAAYKANKEKLKKIRDSQLIDERSYHQASLNLFLQKNEKYVNSTQGFLSNLSVLQNAQSKKAFKIGQNAAIVNATIDTAKAAIGAYSALASIRYVGPALGAAAATAATVAGAYQIAQIKAQQPPTGYMLGGYTGDLPTNSVAGVVHGQEYVMTAAATRRIGVSNLEAMNRGEKSGKSEAPAVNVVIENHGTSKEFDVQITSEEVRIIARDEYRKTLAKDTQDIVASQLQNPNSQISKSLNSTYSMGRR